MNDFRYYASESTLSNLNSNVEELSSEISLIHDDISSFYSSLYTLVFTFAIILMVLGLEKFLDLCFYTKRR